LLQFTPGWGLDILVEAISVPFLIVGMWGTFSIPPCLLVYSRYAFPIFLMHNIFLSCISMAFMAIGLRDSMGLQIPIAIVRATCAISGVIMATFVVKKLMPRLGLTLWGGRI